MKILYTGFDPFGGERVNPSFEAVRLLPDTVAGAEVLRLEIPTVFGEGARVLSEALEKLRPDAVICVGQAGGRAAVTPEYIAINCRDARIPDNAGQQPRGEKIRPDGPDGIITRLPVRSIVERCRADGIPAAVSYTAGTFVCNELMYTLLAAIRERYPEMVGGFVHVPYSTAQAAAQAVPAPGMDPGMMAEALRIAGELTLRAAEAGISGNSIAESKF